MKQVTGFYRRAAWVLFILGGCIITGFCIRLLRPHPNNTITELIVNMSFLGGIPVGIALLMFYNLRKDRRRELSKKLRVDK